MKETRVVPHCRTATNLATQRGAVLTSWLGRVVDRFEPTGLVIENLKSSYVSDEQILSRLLTLNQVLCQ